MRECKIHNENGWLCEKCNTYFKSRAILISHRKDVHGKGKTLLDGTCSFCGKNFFNKPKEVISNHEKHCYQNTQRAPYSFEGKQLSSKHKERISMSTKKAHDNGKGHTWKNRYENPSFAERWLYSILDENKIEYTKELPFHGFFLDVALKDKGLCIEIDGEQHYNKDKFPNQIEADKRKDSLLKSEGWVELRLRWSDVQKDRELAKNVIKEFIENQFSEKVVNYFSSLEKKREEKEKLKEMLIKNKQVTKNGVPCKSIISENEWEQRKEKILNCRVNLNEFGCISKIAKLTGLHRNIIVKTLKHFGIAYKTHTYK